MPPRKLKTEEKIEALRGCVDQGSEAEAVECLKKALTERSNFLVAKAARFAGEKLAYELIPNLCVAFRRFAGEDASEMDKTCAAKRAIVRALYDLDYDDAAFYRRHMGYRQLEPSYGEAVDTAVDVRCTCALGLVASGDPRAVVDLLTLLHDTEWQARLGAIRALEAAQPFHAELVLRHKILEDDEEPEVIAQCFSSLLKAAEEGALAFVIPYLYDGNTVQRESAALALGESRLGEALEALIEASERLQPFDPCMPAFYRAIALQRKDAAYRYLLDKIADAPVTAASQAAEALSLYSYNQVLAEEVIAIAGKRKIKSLDKMIAVFWKE